jgi:hypothetical protein
MCAHMRMHVSVSLRLLACSGAVIVQPFLQRATNYNENWSLILAEESDFSLLHSSHMAVTLNGAQG